MAARAKAAKKRRTQAERREATRAALLDATIECLVEYGYAGTTTTKVVERAGLSRGAQVHHFSTKAELVAEAMRHLSRRRRAELKDATEHLPEGRDRLVTALDEIWKTNSGPMFAASLELWVAARTDPELRAALLPVEREVIASTREMLGAALGSRGADVDDATLNVLVTLILGAGLQTTLLSTKKAADAAWSSLRDHLIALAANGAG